MDQKQVNLGQFIN